MDTVVKLIYHAIEHKPHLQKTLFVLLGDHGMTEKGNHGGDSPGELAAAMVFMSPQLQVISRNLESPVMPAKDYEYYTIINQIDLVPTLAGLLGFSVPPSSHGVPIPELLGLLQGVHDGPQLLLKNAKQLMNVFATKYNIEVMNDTDHDAQCGEHLNPQNHVVCLWEALSREERLWRTSQNPCDKELMQAIRSVST